MHVRIWIVSLLAVCFALLFVSCGGWGTTHSGKYDDTDNIVVYLHRYGRIGVGHGGIGREILESYSFELKPIKRVYADNEIKLTEGLFPSAPIIPVNGTVSFNADYSNVTINIQIAKEGQFQPFAGNGTYTVNAN